MKLIECVPNFSEGSNQEIITQIADAIRSVSSIKLLNIDSNKSANRTVYTFIGSPENVSEAAFRAIECAAKLIDMRLHKGVHPRIGSCDVCPFIPLQDITIEETVLYSKNLAKRVSEELLIPVYSYEYDTNVTYRKNLEDIRYGEYELLSEKMLFPEWQPDFGYNIFNQRNGATVIGTRDFLIAFNINLSTKDVAVAKEIASIIRESGKNKEGGLLKGVKAIGWYIKDFDKVQISTNITNFKQTSIYKLFETVKKTANEFGITVTGSELVGLVPFQALIESSIKYQRLNGLSISDKEEAIAYLINQIGLNEVKPFDCYEQIIEYKSGLLKETNHRCCC